MSTDNLVQADLEDGVLKIVLNRPKVNAFNSPMINQMQAVFKQAERDVQVRCVLLAANGNSFSAGQDLTEMRSGSEISFRAHLLRTYNPLILQIRRLEKPVLAAIQGAVSGAALGIVLACDLRIAAQDARFVVGFSGIGLAPDSAVSLLLPLLIGLGRASEVTFSNTQIDAIQALSWGLVNRIVPLIDLDERAMIWAKQLARGPVHSMGLAKRDFNKAVLANLEEVLEYEAHNQEIASKSAEHQEGLGAFLEKRPPNFA
jgi:2-(1,2-epoxy-1,2-dihydrophenyl)acetyl-CoA isomerase